MTNVPSQDVIRTSKIKQLRDALRVSRCVYIGGRFGSGKTTLLRQLSASQSGDVVRLSALDIKPQPLPNGTTLVLMDDVHQCSDPASQALVRSLLLQLPEDCCAVLCGRARLPIWLKPLYVANQLHLLGEDYLFFDQEEMAQYLLDHGVEAVEPLTSAMHDSTGGWPLLVSLYALHRRETPSLSFSALQTLVTQDMHDCFQTLLYDSFDDETKLLVNCLSPFEHFTMALAQAVCDTPKAADTLRRLEQRCGLVFFDPPDSFSFAPMLRAYLITRLQTADPSLLRTIHARAALFFEQQGDSCQALASYRASGNLDAVIRLLIAYAWDKPGNGIFLEAEEYYPLIPRETMLSTPELMSDACMTASLLMNADESEQWYTALKAFADHTPRQDPRWATATDLLIYLDIALPHRGSRKMPALLKTAAQLALNPGHHAPRVSVAGNSPSLLNGGKDFCVWLPHKRQLYNMLHRVVELALGSSGGGLSNTALGEAIFETSPVLNDQEPLPYLNAGLAEAESCGDDEMRFAATGVMARLFLSQGSYDSAHALLTGFQSRLKPDAPLRLRQNLSACLVRLSMVNGSMLLMRQWMDTDAPNELDRLITLDRYRYMTKARMYIIRGQWVEGLSLLSRMRQYYIRYHRPYGQAEVSLLTAILYRRSHLGSWQEAFREALSICEKYGIIQLMADEGIAICDMATELIPADTPYHAALLQHIQHRARLYPRYLQPDAAEREPLTETERAVYQLLLTGRKNAEIAAVLGITLRTVKFHTANLYRKLNVQTRSQVLKRAAERGEL